MDSPLAETHGVHATLSVTLKLSRSYGRHELLDTMPEHYGEESGNLSPTEPPRIKVEAVHV